MNAEGLAVARGFLTPDLVAGKRVLEVGARNVNGSLRQVVEPLKPSCYIGTDLLPGDGVDSVCPASDLTERYGIDSFDLVLSASCLDLILDWRAAVNNMKFTLKPGGIIYVSVPDVYPKRETIAESRELYCDEWRFSLADLRAIFTEFEIVHTVSSVKSQIAYILARKPSWWVPSDLTGIELRKA